MGELWVVDRVIPSRVSISKLGCYLVLPSHINEYSHPDYYQYTSNHTNQYSYLSLAFSLSIHPMTHVDPRYVLPSLLPCYPLASLSCTVLLALLVLPTVLVRSSSVQYFPPDALHSSLITASLTTRPLPLLVLRTYSILSLVAL